MVFDLGSFYLIVISKLIVIRILLDYLQSWDLQFLAETPPCRKDCETSLASRHCRLWRLLSLISELHKFGHQILAFASMPFQAWLCEKFEHLRPYRIFLPSFPALHFSAVAEDLMNIVYYSVIIFIPLRGIYSWKNTIECVQFSLPS